MNTEKELIERIKNNINLLLTSATLHEWEKKHIHAMKDSIDQYIVLGDALDRQAICRANGVLR